MKKESSEIKSNCPTYKNQNGPRSLSFQTISPLDLLAKQSKSLQKKLDNSNLSNESRSLSLDGFFPNNWSKNLVRNDPETSSLVEKTGNRNITLAKSDSHSSLHGDFVVLDPIEKLANDVSLKVGISERPGLNKSMRCHTVPLSELESIKKSVQNSTNEMKSRSYKDRSMSDSSIIFQITSNEHVQLGIKNHEEGNYMQSFRHLQLAARAKDPTGQLMYALALRHGWGCACNQKESLYWLHRAMKTAVDQLSQTHSLYHEETKSINLMKSSNKKNPTIEQNETIFALAIFELGMSYMNGWGISKDKAMALRCFQTSSTWGDADALNQCGLCFLQGIGTKTDKQKAAYYFRLAEAKGLHTVGTSWIYKPKYCKNIENLPSNQFLKNDMIPIENRSSMLYKLKKMINSKH